MQNIAHAVRKFTRARPLIVVLLALMLISAVCIQKKAVVPNWRQQYDAAVTAQAQGDFHQLKDHCEKALRLVREGGYFTEMQATNEPREFTVALVDDAAHKFRRDRQYKRAEEMYRLLLPYEFALYGGEQDHEAGSLGLASAYARLGSICLNDKRLKQAEYYFRNCMANSHTARSSEDDGIDTINSFALCLEQQNKLSEAEQIYKQAVSKFLNQKDIKPSDSRCSGTFTLLNYADFLKRHKRTQEAAKYLKYAKVYLCSADQEEDEPACFDSMAEELQNDGAVVESKRYARLVDVVRSLLRSS